MPFSEETVGGYLSSNCYSHEEGGNYALDDNGNITCRREYAYTTGSLDSVTPLDTVTYTYGDSEWGDLLTGYDGSTTVTVKHSPRWGWVFYLCGKFVETVALKKKA